MLAKQTRHSIRPHLSIGTPKHPPSHSPYNTSTESWCQPVAPVYSSASAAAAAAHFLPPRTIPAATSNESQAASVEATLGPLVHPDSGVPAERRGASVQAELPSGHASLSGSVQHQWCRSATAAAAPTSTHLLGPGETGVTSRSLTNHGLLFGGNRCEQASAKAQRGLLLDAAAALLQQRRRPDHQSAARQFAAENPTAAAA